MVDSSNLKCILSKPDISREVKALIILAFNDRKPKAVSEIIAIAETHGLREIKKWNISRVLSTSNCLAGRTIRLPNGWEITDMGIRFLTEKGVISISTTKQDQVDLRKAAEIISSKTTLAFVEECILALETGLLRSAVTLSWVGAVSILYDSILSNNLDDFNTELRKRNSKHRQIKSLDDLATIKEYDFLQIIYALSIIGKNVKQELEQCLQLRNACAHPNSLSIGERRVSAHVEILILNVYQNFLI